MGRGLREYVHISEGSLGSEESLTKVGTSPPHNSVILYNPVVRQTTTTNNKEQVDKNYYQFDSKMSEQMKKTLKQENTRTISFIMFYENTKSIIFKVLGIVVY